MEFLPRNGGWPPVWRAAAGVLGWTSQERPQRCVSTVLSSGAPGAAADGAEAGVQGGSPGQGQLGVAAGPQLGPEPPGLGNGSHGSSVGRGCSKCSRLLAPRHLCPEGGLLGSSLPPIYR